MDKIRICRIQVKKLFGNINYNIDLTENNPIAIITAPNGRGKTTILNLVSFIMNPAHDTFKVIRKIPFDEFSCDISNGKSVVLRRKQDDVSLSEFNKAKASHMYSERGAVRARVVFENADFEFSVIDKNSGKSQELLYKEAFQDTFNMDPSEYLDENDDEYTYRHPQRASTGARLKYIWKMQNQLLEENGCSIQVNFIKADRIQPVMVLSKDVRDFDEPHPESPLKIASENISRLIKDAAEKYNEAVSQAKDKLPQMFLDGEGSNLSCDEFMEGWSVYRKELNQYQEIGLITPTKDFTMGKDLSNVYEDKGTFLSTYLSAFMDTTAPLHDIYNRLNLFKQILDERNAITGKKVVFGRDGISLSSGGREISLETLSSGEKHDFIMFYNLIFNVKENGLVLVDEPEISLHIEWQETYLDKLMAICEMNGLQAIVATHSPNIVSSHYDFLVDKGETDG